MAQKTYYGGLNTHGHLARSEKAALNILAGLGVVFQIADTDTYNVGEGEDGTPAGHKYFNMAAGAIVAIVAIGANATVDSAALIDDADGNPIPGDPLQSGDVLTKDVVYHIGIGPHKQISFSGTPNVRVLIG